MINKLAGITAGALIALVCAPTVADAQLRSQNGPVVINPKATENLVPKLRCEIYNVTHVALQNMGGVPIAAGTHVHWALQNGIQGDHVLAVTLAPMQAVLFENVLKGPVRAGTTCIAKIV